MMLSIPGTRCGTSILPQTGSSLLKLAHDGLEREFRFFNQLEGRVCRMCAPGDQGKSHEDQREQPRRHQASTATFSASARISSTRRSFSVMNSGVVLIL